MNKEIELKVGRFIELSKKFSRSADEEFGDDNLQAEITYSMAISGDHSLTLGTQVNQKVVKTPTRGELIVAKAKGIAELSDEYDEYIRLQYELGELFKFNNKLTKND